MKTSLIIIFSFLLSLAYSQNFLPGHKGYSIKKEAVIVLNNGTEIKAKIKKFSYEKRLISEVILNDKSGKRTLMAAEIKYMLVPESGFEKFNQNYNNSKDMTTWNKDYSIHESYIKEGYVFYETMDVYLNGKIEKLLLELINPGFANKIKVYSDPDASTTGSVGDGNLTVAGGKIKSFYIKKGSKPVFLISRSNYDTYEKELYEGCPAISSKFGKDLKWKEIENHIFTYSEECK